MEKREHDNKNSAGRRGRHHDHEGSSHSPRVVIVINNQINFAPNTTQIASGAGRNSAAGNNAALDSSNTEQQQSVGADGKAENYGIKGKQIEPHHKSKIENDDGITIVRNDQQNFASSDQAAATQV
ncbi:MAG TPA: hypothetical protein VFT51_09095, partial [Bacillales bacterium]|nr:hypothetical protein [Bacillales bacterium]